MTQVGWQFDRGLIPPDGSEVPIKCRFVTADESGTAQTTHEFVISESAAIEMIDALRKVASPLTVASNGNGSLT